MCSWGEFSYLGRVGPGKPVTEIPPLWKDNKKAVVIFFGGEGVWVWVLCNQQTGKAPFGKLAPWQWELRCALVASHLHVCGFCAHSGDTGNPWGSSEARQVEKPEDIPPISNLAKETLKRIRSPQGKCPPQFFPFFIKKNGWKKNCTRNTLEMTHWRTFAEEKDVHASLKSAVMVALGIEKTGEFTQRRKNTLPVWVGQSASLTCRQGAFHSTFTNLLWTWIVERARIVVHFPGSDHWEVVSLGEVLKRLHWSKTVSLQTFCWTRNREREREKTRDCDVLNSNYLQRNQLSTLSDFWKENKGNSIKSWVFDMQRGKCWHCGSQTRISADLKGDAWICACGNARAYTRKTNHRSQPPPLLCAAIRENSSNEFSGFV